MDIKFSITKKTDGEDQCNEKCVLTFFLICDPSFVSTYKFESMFSLVKEFDNCYETFTKDCEIYLYLKNRVSFLNTKHESKK